MNMLYVTMTRRENRLGWVCLALCGLVLPGIFWLWNSPWAVLAESAIGFAAVVLVFRRFLAESLRVPHTTPMQILGKAALGLVVSYVATICMNDLFYFYLPEYFAWSDFGPMYYNVNEEAFAVLVRENFPATALAFVVLMPITEEVLFRGVLFGSLLRFNRTLAVALSAAVFAFLPVIGLLGHVPAGYLILNFLQYIPLGLVLCWVYASTQTILTPVALRMILHALAIFSMR